MIFPLDIFRAFLYNKSSIFGKDFFHAMTNQERFIQIFKEKITREGSDKLLEFEGGLLQHSLNVYDCLCDILARPRMKELYGITYSDESIAIAGLLHDICKVNFYKTSTRNVKDETGHWITVPYYTIEDPLPYGHGEKSVYMISAYMKLTRDEAFAIRYHMGFSGTEDVGNVGRALEMFPLAYATVCADMEAAFIMEGKLAEKE